MSSSICGYLVFVSTTRLGLDSFQPLFIHVYEDGACANTSQFTRTLQVGHPKTMIDEFDPFLSFCGGTTPHLVKKKEIWNFQLFFFWGPEIEGREELWMRKVQPTKLGPSQQLFVNILLGKGLEMCSFLTNLPPNVVQI